MHSVWLMAQSKTMGGIVVVVVEVLVLVELEVVLVDVEVVDVDVEVLVEEVLVDEVVLVVHAPSSQDPATVEAHPTCASTHEQVTPVVPSWVLSGHKSLPTSQTPPLLQSLSATSSL